MYISSSLEYVATFKKRQESDWSGRPGAVSCSHRQTSRPMPGARLPNSRETRSEFTF